MLEREIEREIKGIEPDIVSVSTYSPTIEECDSTPLVTASGYKINPNNPKRHRIIAVSRDLKRKYKFGKKVRITGIGKLSGTYTIRDVMNKRFKNKVDILIGEGDKQTSFKKAKLYAVVK
jgi:3D (Asp-Asp-Asp) domain-containing protein